MSAFVVDKRHIDVLVTAGLVFKRDGGLYWYDAAKQTRKLDYTTADAVGTMLLAENVKSVNDRYDDHGEAESYTFTFVDGTPDPVVVLKAIACYEYQSCEHDGWKKSDAKAFCDALQDVAINALPGYGAAPWEIPSGYRFGAPLITIGAVEVTDASCTNPYTYSGPEASGEARSIALRAFRSGRYPSHLTLWHAPAEGGARRIGPAEVNWETL